GFFREERLEALLRLQEIAGHDLRFHQRKDVLASGRSRQDHRASVSSRLTPKPQRDRESSGLSPGFNDRRSQSDGFLHGSVGIFEIAFGRERPTESGVRDAGVWVEAGSGFGKRLRPRDIALPEQDLGFQ